MKRLGAWWFADAPAERLAAVRILVGTFALAWVVGRLGELLTIARLAPSHFRPVGVVRLLDAPLAPWLALALVIATAVLLVAFVAGWRYRVTAPLAAAGLLWTLTYRSAWGMVFHTENLLVLHVIALACAPAADAWSVDRELAARRARSTPEGSAEVEHRRAPRATPPAAGYGWALRLLLAITAVTYVLAGIAKLRIAGFDWLAGEQLRNQIAIDNLRKALLGDGIAPLGTIFLDHPAGFTVFSIATIALELAAPLLLWGGRIARLWALAAWGFHVGVVLLMNIWFPYPLLGLAYLGALAPERPLAWLAARWRR